MPLSANALITLEDAIEYVGAEGGTEDEAIANLVNGASLVLEQMAGDPLKSRAYTLEVLDGRGGLWIEAKHGPITAVTSVEFLTGGPPDEWTAQDLTTGGTGGPYGVHVAGALMNKIAFRSLAFPRASQSVRLAYTAGPAAVDARHQQACRELVMSTWKSRDRQTANIASQSFPGGQSVTYVKGYVTQEIRDLMEGYCPRVIR